jgi:hypothetical protein
MSKIRSIVAAALVCAAGMSMALRRDDAGRAARWGRTEGRLMTHDVFCEYCGDCRDCSEDDYCIAAEEGKHYFAVYESSHSVKS